MTPKKWGVSKAKKGFGGSKHKKLIFSKNLNSAICQNIGGGFHSSPVHPGTIRPLETIHIASIFPPATCIHVHI